MFPFTYPLLGTMRSRDGDAEVRAPKATDNVMPKTGQTKGISISSIAKSKGRFFRFAEYLACFSIDDAASSSRRRRPFARKTSAFSTRYLRWYSLRSAAFSAWYARSRALHLSKFFARYARVAAITFSRFARYHAFRYALLRSTCCGAVSILKAISILSGEGEDAHESKLSQPLSASSRAPSARPCSSRCGPGTGPAIAPGHPAGSR